MKIDMPISNVVNVTVLVVPCILYVGIDSANRWCYRAESKVSDNNKQADSGGSHTIVLLNGGSAADSGGLFYH